MSTKPWELHGAVMYDPKVSVIWAIIRDFSESKNCPIDVTFYSTYELQVTAVLDSDIDIAWNSPLASAALSNGRCGMYPLRSCS